MPTDFISANPYHPRKSVFYANRIGLMRSELGLHGRRPQKELDGLMAREEGSNKVILPIWHHITEKEVKSFSPILAGRFAISSDKGVDCVVDEIAKVFKRNIK